MAACPLNGSSGADQRVVRGGGLWRIQHAYGFESSVTVIQLQLQSHEAVQARQHAQSMSCIVARITRKKRPIRIVPGLMPMPRRRAAFAPMIDANNVFRIMVVDLPRARSLVGSLRDRRIKHHWRHSHVCSVCPGVVLGQTSLLAGHSARFRSRCLDVAKTSKLARSVLKSAPAAEPGTPILPRLSVNASIETKTSQVFNRVL